MYSNETTIVVSYLVYLLISVTLTIWVARTLHKRGAIFLVDAFNGDAELAASVNHLLVVGFYLINIGFVALALEKHGRDRELARRDRNVERQAGLCPAHAGRHALLQSVCLLAHSRPRAAQRPAPSSRGAGRGAESGDTTVRRSRQRDFASSRGG